VIYSREWGAWLGYLAIVILPVCIFAALRYLPHPAPFSKSLATGLLVAFIAATMYAAYTFIDIHFFDSPHLRNLYSYTEKALSDEGKSTAEIEAELQRMQAHYASWKPYTGTYAWYLASGLIYTSLFHFAFRLKRLPAKHP
jgi:hypothetical protein